MYYLGLDPSPTSAGYCIIDANGQLVTYGKWAQGEYSTQGLLVQQNELDRLLEEYPCTKAFCEDQFFGNNIDTLKKLSRVTGVMLSTCAKYNVEVQLVYPAEWRKIYHGDGKKHDKKSTFIKVTDEFNLTNFKFKTHNDITDAIGICRALYLSETEAAPVEN